jgi:hypothetical protein
MTYAFVEDVAASWEQYERFADALAGAVPEGLIVHAAGRTEEGFRIIEIWESEEAWRRFAGRFAASAGAHMAPGPRFFRDLRPAHLVVGRDPSKRPDAAMDGALEVEVPH